MKRHRPIPIWNARSSTQIIENIYTSDLIISKGYILWGPNITKGKKSPPDEPLKSTGGAYQGGQKISSIVNLNNIGPLEGSLTLANVSPLAQLSNYLASLIPGQYPQISGPLSDTQELYDLQQILNQVPPSFLCKSLGLGQGEGVTHQLGKVCRNGVSALPNQIQIPFSLPIRDYGSIEPEDFLLEEKVPSIKIINTSNMLADQIEPQTEIVISTYIQNLDWIQNYGITQFNGTNTFPTMGWAGGLLGSIDPVTFRNQQETLFVWPQGLLPAKPYVPIGIIYAGQGCQYISYIETDEKTYQGKFISEEYDRQNLGLVPYQQGKGSYEVVNREPQYSNGNVFDLDIVSTFPPEGAISGRNNAFAGVALTDWWGGLDLANQNKGSRTPQDTRYIRGGLKQTKTAHNAPLSYISTDENNTTNALPWNSIMTYQGTTGQSASSKKSSNMPIINKGITTMVVGGAYPCYRGTWSAEFSGRINTTSFGAPSRYFSRYLSQYYLTEEFWDPDFQGEPISPDLTDKSMPVEPKPPFRIKGGRITLYQGQQVLAGSYVYSTLGLTGNVNASKFYPDGAKELLINDTNQPYLLGDIYSKYQSNQGTLLVMVHTQGHPPPLPPSNAQPVGIVLETIQGTGEIQTTAGGSPQVVFQTEVSTDVQTAPQDVESTLYLSNRDILVMIWPMMANMYSSGIPSTIDINAIPYGTSVGTYMLGNDPDLYVGSTYTPILMAPLYARIRTNYLVPDSRYAYSYAYMETQPNSKRLAALGKNPAIQWSLKDKEMAQDWPGPHSGQLGTSCTIS